MTKKELITTALENMDTIDLISVHNEYLDNVNGYDDRIYSMDEFNEQFEGMDAERIANCVHFGEYIPHAEYFKFDGYGNIQSLYYYQVTEHIYIDEIADYILKNNDDLYNADIRSALDGMSGEEATPCL